MGEHMLNAMLDCLNELKREYSEKPEGLTKRLILERLTAVLRDYVIDRRDIQYLFGLGNLSLQEVKTLQELDYE